MDIVRLASERAQALEKRLAALLGEARGAAAPRLVEAMRYAALGGGKRLRPLLLTEAAGLFGVPVEAALDAAAAVECVHCYSLVHDDLPAMDDDDVRRGRPTVHKAYDEATAILVGDGLLTIAFEILARPETHPDAAVRSDLALALARAAGHAGMAGGQMLDLSAEGRFLDLEAIKRIQALKTGALIGFCGEAGAILGRGGRQERAALAAYTDALGLAFQVKDDLLDAEGDAALMGKAAQKDGRRGKATFVSLLGLEKARGELCALEQDARAALAVFGERATSLIEIARWNTGRTG
ncbi:MAG: polyprenyl synthetase family protein [Hyphomicrobiaceae bacterium]|nr:MAG: polyprenyl synthetase family protein [Hyphomicrobiaceae bacterium]